MTNRNDRMLAIESHPHVVALRKSERWRGAVAQARITIAAASPHATADVVEQLAMAQCQAIAPSWAEQFDAVRGETLLARSARAPYDALADVRGDYLNRGGVQ